MKKRFRKRVIAMVMALLMVAEVFTSNIGGSGLFSKSGTAYAEGETEYKITVQQPDHATVSLEINDVPVEDLSSVYVTVGDKVSVIVDCDFAYEWKLVDGNGYIDPGIIYDNEMMLFFLHDGTNYYFDVTQFSSSVTIKPTIGKYTAVTSGSTIKKGENYCFTPSQTGKYLFSFPDTMRLESAEGTLGADYSFVASLIAGKDYVITSTTGTGAVTITEVATYQISTAETGTCSINVKQSPYSEDNITEAAEGEQIYVVVTPNSGYNVESLTFTPSSGEPEEVYRTFTLENGDYVFMYEMPGSDISVSANASATTTITSVAEWNEFAQAVNSGENSYEGEIVYLAADIGPVTTSVGTLDHPFKGTFDGQGNTLTVNINNPEDTYVAPFGSINNVVIQNLSVSGSVTGFSFVSGLVGKASGSNTITHVTVTASTSVSASDKATSTEVDHTVAGFIGEVGSSTLTFTYNAFKGSLTTDSFAGGFIGRGDSFIVSKMWANIFDGTYSGEGCKFHPIAIKHELATVTGSPYDNFYTVPASENLPSNLEAIAGNYILFELPSENVPFCRSGAMDVNLSAMGYGSFYAVEDTEIEVTVKTVRQNFVAPTVRFGHSADNMVSPDSYDYSYEYGGDSGVETPVEAGYYTVTVTGKDPYCGSASLTFPVTSGTLGGEGTASYPYVIDSADKWNILAEIIDMGDTDYYSEDYDIYYVLNADITVDRSIGKIVTGTDHDNAYRFSGNFDGKGHTITFNATAGNDNFGLFSQAVYANFKDLTVTGTINTSYESVGGIVGNTNGACTFTNCTSDVTIAVTGNKGNIGGFVGLGGGAGITFNNCLFSGDITGTSGSRGSRGGFVGYANGPLVFNGCVADLANDYSDRFWPYAAGGAGFTFDSSYFVSDSTLLDTNQGIKAYNTAPENRLYGVKTVKAGNITLSTKEYVYSKNVYVPVSFAGFKSDVYEADEAVDVEVYGVDDQLLTEGTDYTVTEEMTDSTDEFDVYTMTFTAAGSSYAGSQKVEYNRARAVKLVTVVEIDMSGNKSAPKNINLYEYEAPSVYLDGYEFVGWKVDGGDTVTTTKALRAAIEATGKDSVEVQSVYSQKATSYSLTVVNGTIKDSTETEGNFKASDQVFVTADAAPAGKVFSHWTIKRGAAEAIIVGYEKTYAFRMPNAEVVVTAVYADAETEKTGVAYLESYYKSGDNKLSFVSIVTVPTDCTILKAGVVANTEAELGGQELTINTTKFESYNSSTCSNYNSYKFTFTKGNVAEGEVWCVRAFLEYEDAQGKTHVVYGDMVRVSLADF